MLRLGTARESVVTLSLSAHVKLRDARVQSSSFSLLRTRNLKIEL
jgi:hypothetical protein